MPMATIEQLVDDEGLHAIIGRLPQQSPGVILASGQATSGKVTTLVALAQLIGKPGQPVILLTDRAGAFSPFHPLPQSWREVQVEPTTSAWEAAMGSGEVAGAPLLVVASLTRESARAVMGARPGQWVLAAVDTALIGIDIAYALYEMGIDNETFVGKVRAVWSQFLVEKLCADCAVPVILSPAELAYLFPTEPPPESLKSAAGCPACNGPGRRDQIAICDVLLIGDSSRQAVHNALIEGTPLGLAPECHVTAGAMARRMLLQDVIGVATYRNAIRRNPLLRAQNTIERERSRSFMLDIASKRKSAFLANMSHELRTPLNAIIGFSDVILNGMAGPVSEEHREFIGDIRDSGRHLLALINDILDLSKIEAGRMELDVAPFDVPTAIDGAMTVLSVRAVRQGVRLEANVAPDVAMYDGDERKFKQIVINLLSNAVKFTPGGGAVTLAATRTPAAYEFSIEDTGIGIAAEDLERVFEEFSQVGNDVARKAEGTGLGLTLTRRLVELHGGSIRATSKPGHGSTFSFTLPL